MQKSIKINDFLIKICFIWVFISALIYSIYTLSFSYSYQGIYFFQQPAWVYFFIYLFVILPLPMIPLKLEAPSDYINVYLYVFTFVPSVVVPFFITDPLLFNNEYIIFLLAFLFSFLYLLKKSNSKVNFLSLIKPFRKELIIPSFIIIYLISLGLFIVTFGVNFTIPSLTDVYDVREQYKEVTKGNILTRYMVGWMGYIINIFVFLVALDKKNKTLLIFSIIFQLYIFSIMALKSHLATMIVAALIFLYLKKFKQLSAKRFIFFVSLLVFSLVFIDKLLGSDILEMLITRRIMVVPSQLVYYHFEFFSVNEKTNWTYSFLGGIFENPYQLPPPNLIGEKYFNNGEMTAVVNFFMEGYTAFGYFGIFIVTLLFKYLMKIIDSIFLYRSENSILLIACFMSICNILNSSSIFTILLTHGLLIHLVLYLKFNWKKII